MPLWHPGRVNVKTGVGTMRKSRSHPFIHGPLGDTTDSSTDLTIVTQARTEAAP